MKRSKIISAENGAAKRFEHLTTLSEVTARTHTTKGNGMLYAKAKRDLSGKKPPNHDAFQCAKVTRIDQ